MRSFSNISGCKFDFSGPDCLNESPGRNKILCSFSSIVGWMLGGYRKNANRYSWKGDLQTIDKICWINIGKYRRRIRSRIWKRVLSLSQDLQRFRTREQGLVPKIKIIPAWKYYHIKISNSRLDHCNAHKCDQHIGKEKFYDDSKIKSLKIYSARVTPNRPSYPVSCHFFPSPSSLLPQSLHTVPRPQSLVPS